MKTAPWFSNSPKHRNRKEQPFYHDNSACPEGASIPEEERCAGTDSRPLCPQCGRLAAAGQ
jgi:hypothetical protein